MIVKLSDDFSSELIVADAPATVTAKSEASGVPETASLRVRVIILVPAEAASVVMVGTVVSSAKAFA